METKTVPATVNHLSILLRDKFGIQDLQDRLIFTACALIIQNHSPQDLKFSDDDDFETIKSHMVESLAQILKREAQETEQLDGLVNDLKAIHTANFNTGNAIHDTFQTVVLLSDFINSDKWTGDDILGIFYNEFARYNQKSFAGQVFTPTHIAQLMYRLINVSSADHVLDATCGSGALLMMSIHNMMTEADGVSAKNTSEIKSENIYGIELYQKVYNLACANMLMHKGGVLNLRKLDAKSEDAAYFIRDSAITKVLMNPPYENKYGCIEIVENVLDNVTAGTKAAFILPNNKLDKNGGKRLLKNHTLHTIIKLPDKTFNNVAVEPSIFIFEAGIKHQEHTKINGYHITEDGLATVKYQGRKDVYNLWQAHEDYWVEAVQNGDDPKYGSHKVIDPNERLSYPEPEVPFQLTMEDFMNVAVDYQLATENDIDKVNKQIKQLKQDIIDNIFYGIDDDSF